ncbi:MAG: LacI family DNA-binding transcriptional regulator [Anaerolineales bacterium]|nr:LacI family DNA-binding transcriptional regulator [Anaerolineales bacterium]
MAITIKDIAKAAGISHTTVSRALRDHPAISSETVARVKQLAASLGYVPSATARGLKTRRTRALGVIVSNIDDPFWSEVLQGIDSILHPAGYSLFVAATHRDKQREKEVVQAMVQRGVDGVILCAPQFSPEQSRLLQTYGLPTAVVNNDGASASPYLVFNDDLYGIRLLTRHLIELGHRRIAFLGNALGGRTTREREQGFREEMQAAGLPVDEASVRLAPQGTPQGGAEGVQALLALPARPTALLCYNDNMAVGVYSALYQAGLRVPHDLSVTGFDDITIAAYLTPPLTTLHQHKHELGVRAANLLLASLEAGPAAQAGALPDQRASIRGELVVRASTAPPP